MSLRRDASKMKLNNLLVDNRRALNEKLHKILTTMAEGKNPKGPNSADAIREGAEIHMKSVGEDLFVRSNQICTKTHNFLHKGENK